MSMIVPAGNSKLKWVPEAEKTAKMEKTASAETDVEVKEASEKVAEEIAENPLYEAAKEYFEQKEADSAEGEEIVEAGHQCSCTGGDCKCGDDCKCKCEGGSCVEVEACAMSDDLPEVTDEGGEFGSDVVIVDVDEDAPETVEEAVEAVEEAVEDLKEVAGVGDEDDEIDIEVDVEVIDEVPEPDEEEEIIIESMPMMDDSGSEEEGVEIDASADGDYIKLSMISPKNRQKIVNYWRDMLGYPSDFVNLMAKDYEK